MRKGIQKYVKYTAEELEQYVQTEGSCVKKVNTELKINIFPSSLRNFKKSLVELLAVERVGSYDHHLKGIILDIRNIKLLGSSFAIRFDDPRILVRIQADCYVFQPTIGAVVRGTVRHVSSSRIGVIIYRVFSVSVRLSKKAEAKIEFDSEIVLKVKKFDLENVVPFIEGELVEQTSSVKREKSEDEMSSPDLEEASRLIARIKKEMKDEERGEGAPLKRIKFDSDDDSSSD